MAEQASGKAIALEVGPRVINACGSLNLYQSADALRKSMLVITHDTGMMHIAAALRKKIITVWGNTVPEFGMSPFYPKGMHLNTSIAVNGLACRPCSKIGYSSCPKGHFKCMNDIDIEELKQIVNSYFA